MFVKEVVSLGAIPVKFHPAKFFFFPLLNFFQFPGQKLVAKLTG